MVQANRPRVRDLIVPPNKQNDQLPIITFSEEDRKLIHLSDVVNHNQIDVRVLDEEINVKSDKTFQYSLLSYGDNNHYDIELHPVEGNNYTVGIYYGNKQLNQTPFKFCKSPASAVHDEEKKTIQLSNIYDPDKVNVDAKTVDFDFVELDKNKDYLIKYSIPEDRKNQIHDIDVTFNDNEIKDASLRLVPEHLKEAYENGDLTDENGNLITDAEGNKILYSRRAVDHENNLANELNDMSINESESEEVSDQSFDEEEEEEEEEKEKEIEVFSHKRGKRKLLFSNKPAINSYTPTYEPGKNRTPIYSHRPIQQTLYPPPPEHNRYF